MCGRFVSSSSPERIAEYFGAESNVETLGENFNVAPTNDIYGVVEKPDGTLDVQVFHWGLIPVWAKERKIGQRMINARSETIAEKAAFKGDFKKHRCIIPMDGFYEWAQGVEVGLSRRPASSPSDHTSSTASMVSRSPWPGCGRRGRTSQKAPTCPGCTAPRW